jgi:hypothetical protein
VSSDAVIVAKSWHRYISLLTEPVYGMTPMIQRPRGDLNFITPVQTPICSFSPKQGQNLNRPIYPGKRPYSSFVVDLKGQLLNPVYQGLITELHINLKKRHAIS